MIKEVKIGKGKIIQLREWKFEFATEPGYMIYDYESSGPEVSE